MPLLRNSSCYLTRDDPMSIDEALSDITRVTSSEQ